MPWPSGSTEGPFYRGLVASELTSWRVVAGESDLAISSSRRDPTGVESVLRAVRTEIETFAAAFPPFLVSLEPVTVPPALKMPPRVRRMLQAAAAAGVGPMAAVAGTIAEAVGHYLCRTQAEVIVENGGDVFIRSGRRRTCAVYAGDSAFSLRVGLIVEPSESGVCVCTSSGTVGPSLSLGRADAAVVVASSGALADALATALANAVCDRADLKPAVERVASRPDVVGALAVLGEELAVQGGVELVVL